METKPQNLNTKAADILGKREMGSEKRETKNGRGENGGFGRKEV